jgi:hypothetical protein
VATVEAPQPARAVPPPAPRSIAITPQAAQPEPEKKKKGLFGRLKDIFK